MVVVVVVVAQEGSLAAGAQQREVLGAGGARVLALWEGRRVLPLLQGGG